MSLQETYDSTTYWSYCTSVPRNFIFNMTLIKVHRSLKRLTVMQKLTKYASSTESSSLSMSMVLCSDVRQMALSSSVKVEQAHLKRNNSIESKEQHEEAQGQIKSPKTWQMIIEQSWWSHKWQNSVCAALREYMWPCVKTKIESISLVIFLIITVTHFRWALAIYIHFGMCLCFYCPQ